MRTFISTLLLFTAIISMTASAQELSKKDYPVPGNITIGKNLPAATIKAEKEAALSFYAFWNTGKSAYLDKAVSPDFFDHTLPEGRPQGPSGPLIASENFRKAVPDLVCDVKDILIAGDKVTVRMIFKGTFTGEFMGRKGNGGPVEFFAIDILHIRNGKIFEDWHLEDNLTLMKQLGVVK